MNRYALATAAVRIVVPQRVMLGAAVVPERYRARLPLEAALKLWLFDSLEEHLENLVTLTLFELKNPFVEFR